jgi:murein DD-endopeptidase MepM/ murein hydrolase activator NlpD
MSVPTSVTSFDLTRTFTLDAAGKDQPIDRDRLVKMAQEFEGMLLLQMVRQMRQSMLMDDEEDTGLGSATMTDTFDVEFANYLAKQGGIGLSKSIEQQIEKSEKGKEAAAALRGIGAEAAPKALGAPEAKPIDLNATPSFPVERRFARPAAEGPPSPLPLSPGRGFSFLTTSPSEARPSEATADDVAAGEATAAHAEAPGHANALKNELPPFLGEGGQGGEGLADLTLPLNADTSSGFGWRNDPFRGHRKFHNGVDLRAAYGTEVPTAAPGKVTFAGERGAYGLMVVVEHPNGVETRYAHLSSTAVQPGDSVAAGQTIGRVGSTGRSTAPHLHFEVLLDGKRVNPEQIASARATGSILPQTGSLLAP